MKVRMKKHILAIPLLPLLLISCQVSNQGSNTVFLSGEIVNPSDEFVVLYKGDQVVDSARLDASNRFTFVLPEIGDGLYHFYHYPEQQYVYLEQGDSIRIRLNTKEFDESLSFSGTGSGINNFLISMFLAYENEAEQVNSFYPLNPTEFNAAVESLREKKVREMERLSQSEQWSPAAVRMARAAIDFDNYIYREKYPFYHHRVTGEDSFSALPGSFYDYRKNLNINNRELSYFRPYYEFMKYHIGNVAYTKCVDGCSEGHRREVPSLHLGKHKMNLIDSLVLEHNLRNNLLRNVAMDYLLQNPRISVKWESFLDEYYQLSSSQAHKKEIEYLFKGIQNLQAGNPLPSDIVVLNKDDQETILREETFTQPVVLYFWTGNQEGHLASMMQRIKTLKQSNSEFRYIGIALRTEARQWKQLLDKYEMEPTEQFRAEDFESLRNKLVIESLNKCVIVRDGKILEAFANINYPLPTLNRGYKAPDQKIRQPATVVE